jgi:translation initiation factor 3 subunit C
MEQIRVLDKYFNIAASPAQRVKVLVALISSRFDQNQGVTNYISIEMWKDCEKEINRLIDILEQNPNIVLSDDADEFDEEVPVDGNEAVVKHVIRGSLVSYVSRLDDEFTKSLQTTDSQTMEYVDRLKDEVPLYGLIARATRYYTNLDDQQSVCLLQMLRLDHIYYKVGISST